MHKPFIVRIKTSSISLQLSPFNFRSGDWEIGRAIFAPLLRFGNDFALQPHLLEDWRLADDYRLVEFRLRPDLVFHNGRPVSAVDLAYSLERGRLQGARTSFRQLLAEVRRIEVMDGLTVQISLARPNRMFPAYFTRAALSLVPQEELRTGDPWRWRNLPVGCGPYQVAALSTDGLSLHLTRNEAFFGHCAASPTSLVFVTGQEAEASDLIIDERVNAPEFSYVPSRFWSTIAVEHYSLNDHEDAQDGDRARDARRLVNAAAPAAQLLAALPAVHQAYYHPAASFVPPAIGGSSGTASPPPDFAATYAAFLRRWGALPRMVNVVYRGYGPGSDLFRLQEVLGRQLRAKDLPVEDVTVDRLDLDLPDTDLAFVLAASSFNYPDYDNLTLFFARGGDIHRASTPGLERLRALLDRGRATALGDWRAVLYAEALALLDQEGWVHPVAHISEGSFVRTAALSPASIYGSGPHLFFEELCVADDRNRQRVLNT